MARSSPTYQEYFKVNPESSIDCMIKNGIHYTFEAFVKRKAPSKQIRHSVVRALNLLLKVNTSSKRSTPSVKRRQPRRLRYFSSKKRSLIELSYNKQSGGKAKRLDQLERPSTQHQKWVSKQLSNEKFKKTTADFLSSQMTNEIEEIIFNGVMLIFGAAEDVVGPAMKIFEQRKPCFKELQQLYEKARVADLMASRGCYSTWLALEIALEA